MKLAALARFFGWGPSELLGLKPSEVEFWLGQAEALGVALREEGG